MTTAEQTTFLEGFQAGCKSMEKQGYVKPVRCGDCKYYDGQICCDPDSYYGMCVPDDWYCAGGKPKEDT